MHTVHELHQIAWRHAELPGVSHVKFKEYSCLTLTLTMYHTMIRPMVGRNSIIF